MVANLTFLFFLLLPFHFSLGAAGGSDILTIRLLIPLLFLAWASHALLTKKIFLPKPLTLAAFTAFLLWATLSLFWAENWEWSMRKVIFWLSFFPFFLVLITLFRNSDIREQALRGSVWGGALIAFVGIVQFGAQFFVPLSVLAAGIFQNLAFFLGTNFALAVAQYPSIFVNIGGHTFLRAFGFFPDPHIFAYYTGMLIPLAWYWASQKGSGRIEKSFPFLLLLATLLSFSRASYLALLGTALGVMVLALFRGRKKFSVPHILIAIGLVALLIVSPIATRFQSSFSAQDGSVTERTRLWQEARENIMDAPFMGVGLGNYPLLVKPSASPREPIYVHNLYLDIAVEIGLVGLFLFTLFVFSCLPVGWRAGTFHYSPNATEFFSYRLALFSSLSIFLIHSFFEYPLFSVHVLTLFLTLLALLYEEKYER